MSLALSRSNPVRNTLRDQAHVLDTTLPAEDNDTPILGHTPTSIISTVNEALAANLSVAFPRTPQRATPNSARRRRPVSDLSRSTPTSSHGTKMSMIFRDAAVTLQELRTPQSKPSPNTKRSRLPVSQARISRFGSTGRDDTSGSIIFETSSSTDKARGCPLGRSSELQKHCPVRDCRTDPISPTPKATPSADFTAQEIPEDHHTHLPLLANPCSPTPISTTASVSRGSRGEDNGKEPISSGFATPSALYSQPPKTPEETSFPEFEHRLPWSSSIPGSDDGEYLPSRGVPLALPSEHHGAIIEGWLNDIKTFIDTDDSNPNILQQQPISMGFLPVGTVPGAPSAMANKSEKKRPQSGKPKPTQALHERYSASSDKENISPAKSVPSPTRPPVHHLANTPSRFHKHKCDTIKEPTGALHFAHPLTPQGHLNAPPKRKKARGSLEAKPDPPKSRRDFTICDDQVANALTQLSPDIELRRKGRRPKRERCTSYWDEDILQPESPCLPMNVDENAAPIRKGRKVLGESQRGLEMMKEKPFVKEAVGGAFGFRI